MSLSGCRAIATIAVSDMGGAREFHEGKLGLSGGEETPDGGLGYSCAGTSIQFHGSPESAGRCPATPPTFQVDDIEDTVDTPASEGVSFQRHDWDPIETEAKERIAHPGGAAGAWFEDPDGSILARARE